MKKQQTVSSPGKKLSRNEMKNLSGGAVGALAIWVCTIEYDCYSTLAACRANCAKPAVCKAYGYCP
jgi:hypothetical protein